MVIVCIPIDAKGNVDPRWGRADRIAVADIVDEQIQDWRETGVDWSQLHDAGTPARHHARVAKFLRVNGVEIVVAHHVGEGMVRMLEKMHLQLQVGASGDARDAILVASRGVTLS